MVRRVKAGDLNDIHCPRCCYNLRGLSSRRCPECGLAFDEDQWQTGLLREHQPTRLDRCDLWQPHQVLAWSLWELGRSCLRPWRILTKLDLRGPRMPAMLMLLVGTLWTYALAIAALSVAIAAYEGVSPRASLVAAGLHWAPRVVASGFLTGLVTFGLVLTTLPGSLRVPNLKSRACVRLMGYWIPAITLACTLITAALVCAPGEVLINSAPAGCQFGAALAIVPATVLHVKARRRNRQAVGGERGGVLLLLSILVALAVSFVVPALLAALILPTTLEPPLWVYF